MRPAILSVIAFLALVVWRFVFAGLHRNPLVRATAPLHRHGNLLAVGLHISELEGVAVMADHRLRDMTDPGCALEETCFYLARKGMPKAEEIATALLQLAKNPALFERWAAQSGAFKAAGQPFSPAR